MALSTITTLYNHHHYPFSGELQKIRYINKNFPTRPFTGSWADETKVRCWLTQGDSHLHLCQSLAMNRRADYLVTEEEISLTRGCLRPGFSTSLIGQISSASPTDVTCLYQPHPRENRAVALDGWLQEGDKICSVNGRGLKNLLHQDAIDLFRNAGYAVSMRECSTGYRCRMGPV